MLHSQVTSSMAMAAKTPLTQNRLFLSRNQGGSQGGYSHCGNPKHVVKNCFKLQRYPDWWDSFNERKSRHRRNRKDGDKKDGKVAVMVSPSISSSITLTATPVTTASSGFDFDSQQNTQSSGNVGFALLSTDSTRTSDGLSIQVLLIT